MTLETRGFVQRSCSQELSKIITELAAKFVTQDLRLVSIVEGAGFRQLLNYIEPSYTVPSLTYITTVCHCLYESLKSKIRDELNTALHVGLTTDI